jgi:Tfp pilus assembly PilM family ATPase
MSGSSKIPELIKGILKPVVDEMNYSRRLYQEQSGQTIEQVILSGGSAYLPQLAEYFSQSLNIKVLIGDPWARISYPQELKPALDAVAPRFAVAIGLGLRGMK